MRRTRPERTLPGPISRARSTPAVARSPDRLDPADGRVHLAKESVAQRGAVGFGASVHVGHDRDSGALERRVLEVRAELLAGGRHQRAVERRGDGERNGALRSAGRARGRGARHRGGVAGDDGLLRRVEVGRGHDLSLRRLAARGLDFFRSQADDRGHRADSRRNRLLHERAAQAHDSNRVGERESSGGDVGGVFAERMARREGRSLQPLREPRFEIPERGDRMRQDRRLSVRGQLELLLRALEAQPRQRKPQRRIGLLEDPPRGVRRIEQGLAHPDRLRALPGKEKREAHQRTRTDPQTSPRRMPS